IAARWEDARRLKSAHGIDELIELARGSRNVATLDISPRASHPTAASTGEQTASEKTTTAQTAPAQTATAHAHFRPRRRALLASLAASLAIAVSAALLWQSQRGLYETAIGEERVVTLAD